MQRQRSALLQPGDLTPQLLCLRFRAKSATRATTLLFKDPKPITMKNGRPATEGSCQVCATKIFKIGAAK
jgi:hypothetical protein